MIDMPSLDHLYKAFEILWMLAKMMPITAIVTVLWVIFLIIWFFKAIKYLKDYI